MLDIMELIKSAVAIIANANTMYFKKNILTQSFYFAYNCIC